ncbi:DNA-binding response regulator [Bacteroidia bacterium]|nr:DNA-binding response regulator [Bacteroidia bacterium]GHU54202.1 DNA-binding response regulator [Bacteroidia bacterium]
MEILIVEDDIAAYENLKNILEEIDPSIQITGHTESVTQTISWLSNNLSPDLICMDTKELKRFLDKFLMHQSAKRSLPVSLDKYPDKMLIPFNHKLIPVDISEISYFYVSNGITRAVLKDNTGFHFMKALDAIYSLLNPSLFFRANKQFIVAKDSVKNLTIWFDNRLLITLDTEVPERLYVSKNRAALFKKWLTEG